MRIQGLLGVFLFLGACTTSATSDGEGDRGPIGKSDLLGSCEDACGGPASEGNCFCDDVCAVVGDCCSDKVTLCGGDDPTECALSCLAECDGFIPACLDDCTQECGLDVGEPEFCSDDNDCADDEICSDTPCVPSCPVCQDCNATCQPKPQGDSCETSLDCDDDGFCSYAEGVCGDSAGQCQVRPDFCITLALPVCGCDGKTYGNSCFAASAGVSVDHEGPCGGGDACCDGEAVPLCIEGASCCADGNWSCNDGAGQSTCEVEGNVCNALCLTDDDCGDQTCDHTVCHGPSCPRGQVCPAVCFGECSG